MNQQFNTIGELIAHLQTYPPETPVVLLAAVITAGGNEEFPLDYARFRDGKLYIGATENLC